MINKIFNQLITQGHCLLFDNAPSFKRTIKVSNLDGIEKIVDQKYMAFTYDDFYSNPKERLSKAFIKIVDCDCNTLEERIEAINYYSKIDRENFICAVYNSNNMQFKHTYGFHIFYKNNFKTAKEYAVWKNNQPFDFIDHVPFYSCVKNPFNKSFVLRDKLEIDVDLIF